MHVVKQPWRSANGKIYYSVLLRESYRENGKVKKRTVANLTNCSEREINAIEMALKHKDELFRLQSFKEIQIKEGASIGAVWAVYQVAQRLGIEKALGADFQGKLALWQVIARVIDQGSRLSAVRLAKTHACEVLGFARGFDENDLYTNLSWLCQEQENIEAKLFQHRFKGTKPTLFLYDVTSSYLEGVDNELAHYGYNRDGKRGKKQIVMGLICDEDGSPLSTELFKGNTQDLGTFSSQIKKALERFGCKDVTFVGDRGMIKTKQMQELHDVQFHYITAITKPQIETLLRQGVLQMGLFDEVVCEAIDGDVRYICRRNPQRAEEIAACRQSKKESILQLIESKNAYLEEHPKARAQTALNMVNKKIKALKASGWLSIQCDKRKLYLEENQETLNELSRLDGCYAIKTDLSAPEIDKQVIHDRYKDLALVEQAFRSFKTSHLELRPIYVRAEESTRGHALVVMLSYMILRELKNKWSEMDLTPEEGLEQLKTLCVMEIHTGEGGSCNKIPEPRDQTKALLDLLRIKVPEVLPLRKVKVDTRKKLQNERK